MLAPHDSWALSDSAAVNSSGRASVSAGMRVVLRSLGTGSIRRARARRCKHGRRSHPRTRPVICARARSRIRRGNPHRPTGPCRFPPRWPWCFRPTAMSRRAWTGRRATPRGGARRTNCRAPVLVVGVLIRSGVTDYAQILVLLPPLEGLRCHVLGPVEKPVAGELEPGSRLLLEAAVPTPDRWIARGAQRCRVSGLAHEVA